MIRREKGFTLVEMAIVIALIVILGMALIPGFGVIHKQDIRRATEKMCSELNIMKDLSRATGGAYTLTIDSGNRGYIISPIISVEVNGIDINPNDNINSNITYSMMADGIIVNEIIYSGGNIINVDGSIVNKLDVILTYDLDTRIKSNIIYSGVTGHYNITY